MSKRVCSCPMSEITKEQVLKIAKLARLKLTDAEVELYQKRLGRVVGYVRELDALNLDVDGFPSHVPEDVQLFREDVVRVFEDREALLKNAPKRVAEGFVLPQVMD